jgi:Protein of unknown function (DUF1573)
LMKSLAWSLLVSVALTPGAPAATHASEAGHGPRIRVEPAAFDFGKATQNKTLRKEFVIRNFGDEALVIESVSTSCGCTAALVEGKLVKPGGTTPLQVSFETRSYEGHVQKSVVVRSNDPTTPLIEVKIEATVQPEGK